MNKLLIVALAVALAACKRTSGGALVDPALSTLVPADTTMLVGIRVEDLTKTSLYKKYLADRSIPQLDDFAKQFELDPRKDIWELLFISNGKESALLGRGKFPSEPDKRFPNEMNGATRSNYRGYTLIGDESVALVQIGGTVAGFGQTSALKKILDSRDKTNGPPAVLAARMKDIPVTAGMWSVYAGSPISLPPGAPANVGNMVKILNSIESGAIYLDLRVNVSGKATGVVSTEPNAKQLHDSLRGLLGLGRLMGAKDDVQMQRLFDGLRVTQDGKNVYFYIEEQEDAITTVMDLMNRAGGPGGRVPTGPQPLK